MDVEYPRSHHSNSQVINLKPGWTVRDDGGIVWLVTDIMDGDRRILCELGKGRTRGFHVTEHVVVVHGRYAIDGCELELDAAVDWR